MNEHPPKESTLRSQLGILRRRKLVLIGTVLVGVICAVALAALQKTSYVAESTVRFTDLNESLGKVGLLPSQGNLPAQTSAQGAAAVTDPVVIARAIHDGGLNLSVTDLTNDITATQQAQSNLVTIDASAPTAAEAKQRADAVARAAVSVANERIQRYFATVAQRVLAAAANIKLPPTSLLKVSVNAQAKAQELERQSAGLADLGAKYNALAQGVATSADLAGLASEPTSPSSLSPVAAGIIGGLVGFLLAIVAIAITESLDRRVHTIDELVELIGLPVLGVVDESTLGVPPLRGLEETPGALNGFRILSTNIKFLAVDDPPKVVLVTSAVPQEGKTTVSAGVAMAAAGHLRVLLVEADLHRPVQAERFGLQTAPGLADYLAGDVAPQDILQEVKFTPPGRDAKTNGSSPEPATFVCITAGSPTRWAAELLASERFTTFINEVREVYDLIVIDSPPLLSVADTTELFVRADAVLMCSRLNRTRTDEFRGGFEMVDRLPDRPLGVVATGVGRNDMSYYGYSYTYGLRRSDVAA